MDDYEVYVVEDDDDTRNAVRDHRMVSGFGRGPGLIRRRPTRTVSRTGRTSASGQAVMVGRGRAAGSRTIFGGLTLGEIIEAAAQVLAALQSLPAPPVGFGKPEVDAPNLILYQAALATHAKRDEQLRTVGSLIGKLID